MRLRGRSFAVAERDARRPGGELTLQGGCRSVGCANSKSKTSKKTRSTRIPRRQRPIPMRPKRNASSR